MICGSRYTRYFNPRPPRGGRRGKPRPMDGRYHISIHAPREGGDCMPRWRTAAPASFQSTPPARGATDLLPAHALRQGISIHAPREGGDWRRRRHVGVGKVFQSTPPARGATPPGAAQRVGQSISIHAPREGGDGVRDTRVHHARHFNPRPPRGGRPPRWPTYCWEIVFQSTPPARGATGLGSKAQYVLHLFQSTPPARGATAKMHSFTCGSLTNK